MPRRNVGGVDSPTRCFGARGPPWTPSCARTASFLPGVISAPRCPVRCCARAGCSMPHDPARVADTKAWLVRAATDLRAAALDLTATPPILEDVVFHCQQAVEKAMKGLLSWHDEPFGKTHDLGALGETCLRMDSTLRSLVDRAAPLTEYAWKFRYPGEDEEPTREEAEPALAVS